MGAELQESLFHKYMNICRVCMYAIYVVACLCVWGGGGGGGWVEGFVSLIVMSHL